MLALNNGTSGSISSYWVAPPPRNIQYSVDGRSDYRFHYLSKGKPTVKLTALSGASSSNKVKVKLYKGNTYYGVVSFSSAGSKQYSTSVEKGEYYLKVSGGCGDSNGWIRGKGTITPVYK